MSNVFVGTGIYTRRADGTVRLDVAFGLPWRNGLEVRRWMNGPGWAGQNGLHTDVIADGQCVFSLVDVPGRSENDDVFLGPHAFK